MMVLAVIFSKDLSEPVHQYLIMFALKAIPDAGTVLGGMDISRI